MRAFELLVLKHHAASSALSLACCATRPGRGCRAGNLHTCLQGARPVPGSWPSIPGSTASRSTRRRQIADLRRDPVQSMSALETRDEDETSASELSEILQMPIPRRPEAVLASSEIAQAVNAAMEALPAELARPSAARDRGLELRRDRQGASNVRWYRALAHLPRARPSRPASSHCWSARGKRW